MGSLSEEATPILEDMRCSQPVGVDKELSTIRLTYSEKHSLTVDAAGLMRQLSVLGCVIQVGFDPLKRWRRERAARNKAT